VTRYHVDTISDGVVINSVSYPTRKEAELGKAAAEISYKLWILQLDQYHTDRLRESVLELNDSDMVPTIELPSNRYNYTYEISECTERLCVACIEGGLQL